MTTVSLPIKPEAGDMKEVRDGSGRFTPGNPGGPGRPRRATEAEYLRRLSDAVPLDTWQQIVEQAVAGAIDGDATARAWLSKYLIGDGAHLTDSLTEDEKLGRLLGDMQ